MRKNARQKNKGGRPSKKDKPTNETISDKFISALRLGLSEKTAAEYVGVSEDSIGRWKKKDAGFADAIKKAHAEAKRWWCVQLMKSAEVAAAKGSCTPMMFWLSRRTEEFKEKYEVPADTNLSELAATLGRALVSTSATCRVPSDDTKVYE